MQYFNLVCVLVSSFVFQGVVTTPLPGLEQELENDEATQDSFGYLVVSPKVLFSGKNESICVTISDSSEPVDVTVRFMEDNVTEIATLPPFSVEFSTACATIQVPTFDESPKTVILNVQMKQFTSLETELMDEKKVTIFKKGSETFIQTDKPIYKPGQSVMFRVLTLDEKLKPVTTPISQIWVETPLYIRVAQWLDEVGEEGLVDLMVPMSANPPLGEWKIVVIRGEERTEQTFKVDEYVLPKFEIVVTVPPFILITDKEFDVRICARYTYGQPVRGAFSADITIEQYRGRYSYYTRDRPVLRYESADTGDSGCGTVTVSGEEVQLNSSDFSIWNSQLKVVVNFTEEATGVTLSETSLSKEGLITSDPLLLAFRGPSTFKPGMPFNVALSVKYPDGTPAPGQEVTVTAMRDYNTQIYNQTHTSSEDGLIDVALGDLDININSLNFFAEASGFKNWKPYNPNDTNQYDYHYIYDPIAAHFSEASYSPSGSFVQVAPVDGKLRPGTEQEITIHYTADPDAADTDWYFVFMSRNEILTVPVSDVEDGAVRRKRTSEPYIDNYFNFTDTTEVVNITTPGQLQSIKKKFRVSPNMSPLTRLLVYYIRPDQEVVADSITFDVQPVFENEVTIAFASDEKTPGGKATLKLSAAEGSLCSVGIIDKSVYVLEDPETVSKDKVFDKIRETEQRFNNYWTPNQSNHCPNEYPWWWYGGLDKRRRKRTSVPYFGGGNRYEDSSKAFKDMGLLFLTNLKVETRPCYTGRYPVAVPFFSEVGGDDIGGSSGVGEAKKDLAASVRSIFPETWLWKLVRIGESGEGEIDLDVPHTITDWKSNGFCTSTESGFGISETSTLRAFQPFFVSLTLPYSIIRGEEVPIKATVFNYLSDECLVVRVSLLESEELTIAGNTLKHSVCVCAGKAETIEFEVTGQAVGEAEIEVHAVSVADDELLCGNEVAMSKETGISDAVRRKLLVEPEGIPNEYSINKYFCPRELLGSSYIEKFGLSVPPNAVEGSVRGVMSLTGDMMGQTISNLDNLLQMPTGCGEQNMLGFVPNIVALQYFTKSGTLTEDVRLKAETNLKKGYMQELNYRHKDGSYSAFGESDDSGSTWLTAYVVRSFAQAAEFISIDQSDLDVSLNWLKERQNVRGCFNSVGHLCHKAMAGGVNNELTLTAYVLTSMLEAGVAPEEQVIQDATECLETEAQALNDTYAAAQLAYAAALTGHRDIGSLMYYLDAVYVDEGNLRHWVSSRKDSSEFNTYYLASKQAQEIEMTAYVLLAYIEFFSPKEATEYGSPIARWLVSQRSSKGGFSSTQDTVVGLQALAAYAGILSSEPLKMRVELMERSKKLRQFELLEKNKLVVQEMELDVPKRYIIRARGKGCGLIQFTVHYNLPPLTPPIAPFTLTQRSQNLENDCKKYTMNLCASYTGSGEANMVLTQVTLMTGFSPDASSINDLKAQSALSPLKRIDTDGKVVSFYLEQGLESEPVCWDFVATRDFDVKNAKPGTVNMFDYYEKDLAVSDSFEFVCEVMPEPYPDMTTEIPIVGGSDAEPDPMPVDPDAKPDPMPVDPDAKPDPMPVDPDAKPEPMPVDPDAKPEPMPVDPDAKPDPMPVDPDATPDPMPVDPVAKPDPMPGDPDATPEPMPVDPDATPEPMPVDPDAKPEPMPVDPDAKPDPMPVDPDAKPDPMPVDPDAKPDPMPVDPDAKPEPMPVDPDAKPEPMPVDPNAKPDPMPVDPDAKPDPMPGDPDATPEPMPVDPDATPEPMPVDPDVKPEPMPVDPDAKPDPMPVDPDAKPDPMPGDPDATPEPMPVDPDATPDPMPVDPDAKPDPMPVDPDAKPEPKPVDPDAKPEPKPVDPDAKPEPMPVDPDAKPDPMPVDPDAKPDPMPVDPDAKPDPMPVDPDAKPDPMPGDPDATPEPMPVDPDATPEPMPVDPDAKPEPMPVDPDAKPDPMPVDPDAKPDPMPVDPDAKPDPMPGDPDAKPDPMPVDPDATPEPMPVDPDATPEPMPVDPDAKPDPMPGDPDAKPDPMPVDPDATPEPMPVDPDATPEPMPVDPDAKPEPMPDATPGPIPVDPDAKPEPMPVDPDAKPDPMPVDPDAKPEPMPVDPDTKPDPMPVDPDAKPDPMPVDPNAKPDPLPVDPDATPEPMPVDPDATPKPMPVDPDAKPDPMPVDPDAKPEPKPVDPNAKPVLMPVDPDATPEPMPVDPDATPELMPVDPDVTPEPMPVDPDAKPDPMPVDPDAKPDPMPVDPDAKPDPKPVDPDAKPDPMPVDPDTKPDPKPVDPDAKPEPMPVDPDAKPDPMPVDPDATPKSMPVDPDATPEPMPAEPSTQPDPIPPHPVVDTTVTSYTTEHSIADPDAKPEPVDPDAKPEPVDPDAKPEPKPVDPGAKPDPMPVDPDAKPEPKPVDPDAKPEPMPVDPDAKPDPMPVDPDAKPDPMPVDPDDKPDPMPVDPDAKPDPMPVDPDAKPEPKPVDPDAKPEPKPVDPNAKPEPMPVDPNAKPDPMPADATPEPVDPDATPEPMPDATPGPIPDATPEPMPDATPELMPVDPDATPELLPVDLDATPEPMPVDPDATPELMPVDPDATPEPMPVDPDATPELMPVDPDATPEPMPVDPDATPEPMPVDPDATPELMPVDPDATPEPMPVDPDATPEPMPVDSDATPELMPVDPDATPEPMPVDPDATPELMPVDPDATPQPMPADPDAKPEPMSTERSTQPDPTSPHPVNDTTELSKATTRPPTTTTVIADSYCTIFPSVCGDGLCIDDETAGSYYQCDCYDGFVFSEEIGLCVASASLTTTPTVATVPTTVPTMHTMTADYVADTDECSEGLCNGPNKLCYNIPGSYQCYCEVGYEEDNDGNCIDLDECSIEGICVTGNSTNKVCTNVPGTYECNCLDGFQEDADGNCFECPVCAADLPSGFQERFCEADYVFGTKRRDDGLLRILIELRQEESKIREVRYIEPIIDSRCTCPELMYGDRLLIITTMDKVDIQELKKKTNERVDVAGAYIVPLKPSTKRQIGAARTGICPAK